MHMRASPLDFAASAAYLHLCSLPLPVSVLPRDLIAARHDSGTRQVRVEAVHEQRVERASERATNTLAGPPQSGPGLGRARPNLKQAGVADGQLSRQTRGRLFIISKREGASERDNLARLELRPANFFACSRFCSQLWPTHILIRGARGNKY